MATMTKERPPAMALANGDGTGDAPRRATKKQPAEEMKQESAAVDQAGGLGYHEIGTLIAMGIAAVAWGALWVLNGVFSVRALTSVFGLSPVVSWALQVAASLLEAKLWRARNGIAGLNRIEAAVIIYPILTAVAFADVSSSALGLFRWADERWISAPLIALSWPALAAAVVSTLAAMVIALAVEPVMVILLRWFRERV